MGGAFYMIITEAKKYYTHKNFIFAFEIQGCALMFRAHNWSF